MRRRSFAHHMRADVVVDLVEDAIVTVEGGQAAAEVGPLLHQVLQTDQAEPGGFNMRC